MSRHVVAAAVAVALVFAAPAVRAERRYRVLVDSKPRGARVYIDTKDDGSRGKTPLRVSLPAGTFTLIVERAGYATATREVEVRPRGGVQKFRFRLDERITGTVEVTATSGDAAVGATVKIDDEEVGTAPGEFEVDVGPHVIEVVPDGGEPFEDWIEVVEGETVTVSPELGDGGAGGYGDADEDLGDEDLGDEDLDDEDLGDEDLGDEDLDDEDDGGSVSKRARRADRIATAMAVVDTGLDLGGRHFSYSGVGPVENLRPYDADGVPLAHVGAELFPLATSGVPGVSLIGVAARFDRSLGLSSSTSDGVEVSTTWSQWELGGRVRYAVAGTLLSAEVSYGRTAVIFEPAAGAPMDLVDQVPEVDYRFIRLGGEVRYDEGAAGYIVGGSYLAVRSAGKSAERFQDSAHSGFGLRAGFAFSVLPRVEARVMGHYDYFASAFLSESGDQYIADGAADHMYGVLLGAAFVY